MNHDLHQIHRAKMFCENNVTIQLLNYISLEGSRSPEKSTEKSTKKKKVNSFFVTVDVHILS
jgi:hypothetical protein